MSSHSIQKGNSLNSHQLKRTLIGAALVVATAIPLSASAAVDMFMKLTSIPGESTDAQHRGEIDVLAWSWGASTGARTGKGTIPNACVQDLSFTKYIDVASPSLIMRSVTGDTVASAKLTVRKSGQYPVEYLVMTMTNVRVSSYSTGGSGGEDRLTENVTLHFDHMKGVYKLQNADGSTGSSVIWDIGGGCK
jgi:type VI secretion system secreted protein Hcp